MARGFPEIDVVRWIRKGGEFVTIEQDCLRRGELPSKAYGYSGCTSKWKQQPIDQFIRNHPLVQAAWGRGEVLERWIGYDAGEPSRAQRMLAKNPQPEGKGVGAVRWTAPLTDWDMARDECVDVIERAGLPLPGKSSCFHCPSTKKSEIIEMGRKYPEYLKRAIQIEKNALPNLTTSYGLGRSFSWRGLLLGEACALQARDVIAPDCGCYDGDAEPAEDQSPVSMESLFGIDEP